MRSQRFSFATLALAFVVALQTNLLFAQEAGAANDVANAAAPPFDVPKGKDAQFYKELTPKLIKEFNERFAKTTSREERSQLHDGLGDAFLAIFRYAKDGDEAGKRVAFNALHTAISQYALAGNYDKLKEFRKDREMMENDEARARVDMDLIRCSVFDAIEKDDKDALKATVEEFFAKSENNFVPNVAVYIYWKTLEFDPELAKAFSARVVDEFQDGIDAQKEIANLFVGYKRFNELVGKGMKVEGLFLDGTEIDWESYRGKVVLVDFWATWCGWCVQEFPEIEALYDKYRDQGFVVIGYSVDEDLDDLKKFNDEGKLPWKTLSQRLSADAKKKDGTEYLSINEYYGIDSYPTLILVGKDGKVIDTNARGDRLVELLEEQFPDVK